MLSPFPLDGNRRRYRRVLEPEVKATQVMIGTFVRIAVQISEVLHQHNCRVLFLFACYDSVGSVAESAISKLFCTNLRRPNLGLDIQRNPGNTNHEQTLVFHAHTLGPVSAALAAQSLLRIPEKSNREKLEYVGLLDKCLAVSLQRRSKLQVGQQLTIPA